MAAGRQESPRSSQWHNETDDASGAELHTRAACGRFADDGSEHAQPQAAWLPHQPQRGLIGFNAAARGEPAAPRGAAQQ